MTRAREEILEALGEIVGQIAGIPATQVKPASSFAGLGIGPLRLTNVVEEAEIRWDMGIPDQDIDFTTVGELADYILQWQG
jgi:Phosphopantetheine attachment site